MRLNNKIAIITGRARGMGLATAHRFLDEAACVVIADFNEHNGLEAVRQASQTGFSEKVLFQKTDVASEDDIEAMINRTISHFGGLDIIFNNAGVGGAIGPLTETTTDDWDYTFDVLAKGVFLGIKHAARAFRAHAKGGSILNTASIAGLSGAAGPLVSSAAKAAVISMTTDAALELGPDRLRVNAI